MPAAGSSIEIDRAPIWLRTSETLECATPLAEDAGPAMLTVAHQRVAFDTGEVVEALYVHVQWALSWHEGSPCREVAAVFLRPGDPTPAGPSLEAGGLSLVLSNVLPGRWDDGVLDYAPGLGFCLRITAGPFELAAGNDNG